MKVLDFSHEPGENEPEGPTKKKLKRKIFSEAICI